MLDFPVIRQPLVPDKVFVLLALVGPTPHGAIGMEWLFQKRYQELGEPPFGELLGIAATGLGDGPKVEGHGSDDGDILVLHRDKWMAGSAVALPSFHERMSSILGAQRLIYSVRKDTMRN